MQNNQQMPMDPSMMQQYQQPGMMPVGMPGYQQPPQNFQQYPPQQQDPSRQQMPPQPNDEGASAENDESDDENKGKAKRRSKNDVQGRDHQCKYCDKTYLSYPALYTHMKQKHSKGPDGTVVNPPSSGRGRGRPRKNVSFVTPGAPATQPTKRRLLPDSGPAGSYRGRAEKLPAEVQRLGRLGEAKIQRIPSVQVPTAPLDFPGPAKPVSEGRLRAKELLQLGRQRPHFDAGGRDIRALSVDCGKESERRFLLRHNAALRDPVPRMPQRNRLAEKG